MTSRRAAWWLLVTLAAALLVVLLVDGARGENYGTATLKQQAFVRHAIHAWFDPHKLGATMICVARRESGFTARAFNDDDAPAMLRAGVFQISWPLWSPTNPAVRQQPVRYGWVIKFWHHRQPTWQQFRTRLADPVQSVRYAYMMVRHLGLIPWRNGC